MKHFLNIFILLLSESLSEVDDETCSVNNKKADDDCQKKNTPVCDEKIQLPNIQDQMIESNNIFFIESSPKEILSSREACALESAARNSDLSVIMVRVSPTLDIRDNTTCQIYLR